MSAEKTPSRKKCSPANAPTNLPKPDRWPEEYCNNSVTSFREESVSGIGICTPGEIGKLLAAVKPAGQPKNVIPIEQAA